MIINCSLLDFPTPLGAFVLLPRERTDFLTLHLVLGNNGTRPKNGASGFARWVMGNRRGSKTREVPKADEKPQPES